MHTHTQKQKLIIVSSTVTRVLDYIVVCGPILVLVVLRVSVLVHCSPSCS